MSMRLLASSGFVRAGRARRPGEPVAAAEAATTNAVSDRSSTIRVQRAAFMATPPGLWRPGFISEIRPHAEANRARDAEDVGALRGERVGTLRIDALAAELVRHG